jgi:hypothetical protein
MSRPNPSVRACYHCGAPALPFPEPELCGPCYTEVLDHMAKDLASQLACDIEAGHITEADAEAAAHNAGLEP